MSKNKKLLSENHLMRLMKLANIEHLGKNFIKENQMMEKEEEVEASSEEAPQIEPQSYEDVDTSAESREEEVKRLVMAIADAIQSETGIDIDVEGEETQSEKEQEIANKEAGGEAHSDMPAPSGMMEADTILQELGYKKHISGKYYKEQNNIKKEGDEIQNSKNMQKMSKNLSESVKERILKRINESLKQEKK